MQQWAARTATRAAAQPTDALCGLNTQQKYALGLLLSKVRARPATVRVNARQVPLV